VYFNSGNTNFYNVDGRVGQGSVPLYTFDADDMGRLAVRADRPSTYYQEAADFARKNESKGIIGYYLRNRYVQMRFASLVEFNVLRSKISNGELQVVDYVRQYDPRVQATAYRGVEFTDPIEMMRNFKSVAAANQHLLPQEAQRW